MRTRPTFALPLLLAIAMSILFPAHPISAQQAQSDHFEVRGTVINSANNQPVAGALVEMPGAGAQFTNSDGTFVFTDVPRGQFSFGARKPGFFGQEDAAIFGGASTMVPVPSDRDLILKLTPEAIIYGEVKNDSGQPLESLSVKAQRWHVENGRRRLVVAAQTMTNDEGEFRLAELRPGNYYISFEQVNQANTFFGESSRKTKKTSEEQGYGSQFYPGVYDIGSATAVKTEAGAQVHLGQTLSAQHLYEITGAVRGLNPEDGVNVNLVNTTGESVQKRVRLDKTGAFRIEGVPAGTYLLSTTAWTQLRKKDNDDAPQQQLMAAMPIAVNSDISGIVLVLGPGISVGVRIRNEMSAEATAPNTPQVSVEMIAQDLQNFAEGLSFPPPAGVPRAPKEFEGLMPGTYAVQATPFARGYVADLRCGTVDLLRDDLNIAPGMSPPPIEVTLRDDGADLDVTITENGQPSPSALLLYSEDYPKRSTVILTTGSASLNNLPPGVYQLVAMKHSEDIEFRDPAVMAKYLPHAKSVTLGPHEKGTVHLELHDYEEAR